MNNEYLEGLPQDREDWREVIRRAPDEELLALREADYLGFIQVKSEHWRAVLDAIKDEMQRRGLNVSREAA